MVSMQRFLINSSQIKEDVANHVIDLFVGTKDIVLFNHTFLHLIPKKANLEGLRI